MIKLNESGQILAVVFVALGLVLFTVLSIVSGAQLYFSNASYSVDSEKATTLAEAGVDKAIASLNETGGTYLGESETSLGGGSYSTTITSKDAGTKVIEATGYVPNKTKPKAKRTVKIEASKGIGVAFQYAVQIGEGGLDLNSNNQINGSVYSNGPIYANSNNTINGDAWVAAAPPANANQETDCQGVNCQDFIFGKDVGGQLRLDAAQSFRPSITAELSKISLKLKKIGSPADANVRIMENKSGSPDKNKVLTTGTLLSSLVTNEYSFVDITFNSTITLDTDKTYWLMIDASSNSTNYWAWQNDLAQSYTRGSPKWSPNWQASNPVWNNISGDLAFKVYLGGIVNALSGNSNFRVNGDGHANRIEKVTIGKDAYYKTIVNSSVAGNSYPNSDDPPPKPFPISEGNISAWKNQAQSSGISTGDLNYDQENCPAVINSKKIVGNVFFNSNCTTLIKSPLWITGNLTLNSNITLKLHPDYGPLSGIIIVDGKIDLNSNIKFQGSGVGSSILMGLSTFDSRTNDETAIRVNSNGVTGAFYADKGIIEPGTNNTYIELTAWKIRLVSNTTINYDTGLSSNMFSGGPSGSYSLVKGTYQIK